MARNAAELLRDLMEAHAEERRLWEISNFHTGNWNTAFQRVRDLKKLATEAMLDAELIDLDNVKFQRPVVVDASTQDGPAAVVAAPDDIPF